MPLIKSLMFGILIIASACVSTEMSSPVPKRDINAVLRDHDKELMAIPNVVGVYVGAIPGTNESCLKVMLKREPAKDDQPIPQRIEGYHVVTEVTGEIRPLKSD